MAACMSSEWVNTVEVIQKRAKVENKLWHRRLGHLNPKDMLQSNKLVTGYNVTNCD